MAAFSIVRLPSHQSFNANSNAPGFVTAVQRRKQMGHKSEDTFLSYLSDTSGLNMQDLVNDHQLMEAMQTMVMSYRATIDAYSIERDDGTIKEPTSFRNGVVRPASPSATQLIMQQDRVRANIVDLFYLSTGPADFDQAVALLAKAASTGPRLPLTYPGVQSIQDRLCPYCKEDIYQVCVSPFSFESSFPSRAVAYLDTAGTVNGNPPTYLLATRDDREQTPKMSNLHDSWIWQVNVDGACVPNVCKASPSRRSVHILGNTLEVSCPKPASGIFPTDLDVALNLRDFGSMFSRSTVCRCDQRKITPSVFAAKDLSLEGRRGHSTVNGICHNSTV